MLGALDAHIIIHDILHFALAILPARYIVPDDNPLLDVIIEKIIARHVILC